jgi:hypothetical protein
VHVGVRSQEEMRRITVKRGPDLHSYQGSCPSSTANMTQPGHQCYTLAIHCSGITLCTCPNFMQRGGACKHLHAAQLIIDAWVHFGHEQAYFYPTTLTAACDIFDRSKPCTITIDEAPKLPQVIDWTLVQAFGNDNTTVDDQEPMDLLSGERNSSDNADSSDTDADDRFDTPPVVGTIGGSTVGSLITTNEPQVIVSPEVSTDGYYSSHLLIDNM